MPFRPDRAQRSGCGRDAAACAPVHGRDIDLAVGGVRFAQQVGHLGHQATCASMRPLAGRDLEEELLEVAGRAGEAGDPDPGRDRPRQERGRLVVVAPEPELDLPVVQDRRRGDPSARLQSGARAASMAVAVAEDADAQDRADSGAAARCPATRPWARTWP